MNRPGAKNAQRRREMAHAYGIEFVHDVERAIARRLPGCEYPWNHVDNDDLEAAFAKDAERRLQGGFAFNYDALATGGPLTLEDFKSAIKRLHANVVPTTKDYENLVYVNGLDEEEP